MGHETYSRVLRILTFHKESNSNSYSEDIQASLKPLLKQKPKMKELCFSLEMLLWQDDQ